MNAAPVAIDERAFDVDAEHPRHVRGYRRIDRRYSPLDRLGIVADKGGQETCGAEASMCGGDPGYRLDIGTIVEEQAAPAIDLSVYEAGHQPSAVEMAQLASGRYGILLDYRFDLAFVDQERGTLVDAIHRQNGSANQRSPGHRVCVTFDR